MAAAHAHAHGATADTARAPSPATAHDTSADAMAGMHHPHAASADTTRRPASTGTHGGMEGMPGMETAPPARGGVHGRMRDGQPAGGAPMMQSVALGGGWTVMGMAQAIPLYTVGAPGRTGSPLRRDGAYLTQPAVMVNVQGPGARVVLRTTLNFEALTQPGGELTFGGWGEGFIDKRHPHTLLHEAMLSANAWKAGPGALSISAGKGFAPFGTDDPMSRPVAKYPTNHHLSQLLERWTLNAAWALPGWTLEAGLFAGAEPTGPYDLGNWRGFGDSWSARVTRSLGAGVAGATAPWELSASAASLRERHAGGAERDRLLNAAVRHQRAYGFGGLYALGEASWRRPRGGDGWWAALGETEVHTGRHQPYYRVELSTRPEYARRAADGDGFFRYDESTEPVGATRWLINTVGYRHDLARGGVAAAPFVEAQHSRVWAERGAADPRALFGAASFWSLSAGVRVLLGGGPMRMGSYGVRDDMTNMHRGMEMGMKGMHGAHGP
ncbi:MAG: hypothetical protein JWM27_2673, partial [Gemmatimonadetes bacterium]|nr:hypothetical protein [Gemmatimonadota bacterium]